FLMSNSISSTSAQSSTSTEQSSRGRHNRGGRTGGRPYRRRGHGERHSENPTQSQNGICKFNKLDKVEGSTDSTSFSENGCIICTESITYYAVAECNHRTCHLCSLRLRALYKNKNCAYCKTEQTKVIFTRDPEKPFQDYEDTDIPFKDEKLNIFCEDQEIYDEIMKNLRFNCPGENCKVVCDGWQDLKKHVRREHKLWLCNQLDKHYQEGDESGFTGHPRCDFCYIDFYGDDELYEHCRSSHEQCHMCLRAGIKHQYYVNYGELEKHFKNDHFLCLHQECLDKKFVVFETDIDLKAHELETHGSYVSGQRAKQQARRIEVNFISYGESRFRNRQRNQERQVSENRSDDNDGGGSTIEEAVQQIRNIHMPESNSSGTRAVRPPPGFGVLSPNEVISPPDEPPPPPPQNVQRNRTPNPTVSRVRDDEFPTLSAASRVINNAGIPPINYSEKVRGSRSLINKSNPTLQQRSTLNGKGKPSTSIIQPMQGSSSGTSSKGKELAQPVNQTTSISDIQNHNQRVKNNAVDTVISSRQEEEFLRRVSGYLSNNQSKMNEFRSFTSAYRNEVIDAPQFVESLWNMFNKRTETIGKVVSGFVDVLDSETNKSALLSAWNDRKSM
ncbi:18069_t:CDS:2, partial [Cetraspora pellucida]